MRISYLVDGFCFLGNNTHPYSELSACNFLHTNRPIWAGVIVLLAQVNGHHDQTMLRHARWF